MKFQQLPLGARFEYEGKIYVKSGPLTASSQTGGQKMIPRFAVLRPLDGQPPPPVPPARCLEEVVVRSAFDAFYADCLGLCQDQESDVLRARTRRALLETARERFFQALGKAPE
ncbi:MAG: hypothetical protein AB1899_11975 [Pseudomonadota bacterium]